MTPQIMPVTDLRRDTRAVLQAIQENGVVVYITQHGRPTAVMLDYRQYERLVAQQSDTAPIASPQTGVSGQSLRPFAGSIEAEELALMQAAIADGCEQVDVDEW